MKFYLIVIGAAQPPHYCLFYLTVELQYPEAIGIQEPTASRSASFEGVGKTGLFGTKSSGKATK